MAPGPGLVDKDEFLSRLAQAFESSKTAGSIWITHKRLTYDGSDKIMASTSSEDSNEYICVLKATDGKAFKISTHVKASELSKFHAAYGTLLKTSMTTLKKRDKKKEKARLEKNDLRRKRLAQDVKVTSSKRGKGRRKFQRQMKAALKQVGARLKLAERDEVVARKLPTAS